MRAVKCVVCEGRGDYGRDISKAPWSPGTLCHGCKGKGWIEVREDIFEVKGDVLTICGIEIKRGACPWCPEYNKCCGFCDKPPSNVSKHARLAPKPRSVFRPPGSC